MKTEENPKKITRRQAIGTMAKVAGVAVAGLAAKPSEGVEKKTATKTATAAPTEERNKLAQKYKNAKPGEKFMVGHITWGLA